jgi:hypothetical protein
MPSKKRPTPRERIQQATTKAKKDRAGRTKARRMATKAGLVKKGDGKDVHHKDGNPRNNSSANLSVKSRKTNRSTKRKGGSTRRRKS